MRTKSKTSNLQLLRDGLKSAMKQTKADEEETDEKINSVLETYLKPTNKSSKLQRRGPKKLALINTTRLLT